MAAEAPNTAASTAALELESRPAESPLSESWTNLLSPLGAGRRPSSFLPTRPTSAVGHDRQDEPAVARLTLASKLKDSWTSFSLLAFLVVFAVLYSLFVSQTLLSPEPKLGKLLLQASDTNVLISVLSQVFANLLSYLYKHVLDSMRWHFAAGPVGLALPTFFELGAATSVVATFFLSITAPWKSLWGFIRLVVLPVAWIFLGSMLKFQANFEYYFQQIGSAIPVFSGILALNTLVLTEIPPSVMCVYFISWTSSLLGDPKFSVPVSDPICGTGCTSYFLPSGIETVRRVSHSLNETLLEGGLFEGGDSIQIPNAPGLLLAFTTLDSTFEFNLRNECTVYGQQANDSLQLCIRQIDSSIAVGWKACPTPVFTTNTCQENTTWLDGPISTKTMLTTYAQFATTAYQQTGFAILNTDRVSQPMLSPLRASDYQAIWNTILRPSPFADSGSLTMINAFTFSAGWLLRLYDDFFPDDRDTPATYLENFLAVPLQFMVTAFQFANYTESGVLPGLFALPDNMTTVAVSGTSTERLIGRPWVVWTFIAVTGFLVACVGAMLIWMVAQARQPQPSAGVLEIAVVERAGHGYDNWVRLRGDQQQQRGPGQPGTDGQEADHGGQPSGSGSVGPEHGGGDSTPQTFEAFVKTGNLSRLSLWGLARHVRQRRVQLAPANNSESERLCLYIEKQEDTRQFRGEGDSYVYR